MIDQKNEKHLTEKPRIYSYDDYRRYLSDLYRFQKAIKPCFSYRYFSQRAGFKSTNFLKLVVEGQRNLTSSSIEKIAKGFKLSPSEIEFFEVLVFFNQSDLKSKKSEWARRLVQLKVLHSLHPLEEAEMNYYRSWYYLPIRELVSQKSFKEDADLIAQQMCWPLTPEDVHRAIKDLLQMGLLRRSKKGRLEAAHQSVTTKNEVHSSLVAGYHKEMLRKAADSIDLADRSERDISALCVPVSNQMAEKIKKRIQDFRKELLDMAQEDGQCDRVYQINFQFFPLTKSQKDIKE